MLETFDESMILSAIHELTTKIEKLNKEFKKWEEENA